MNKKEAIQELKKMVKAGGKVYTSVEHVSQSGMSREISLYVVHKGDIVRINYYARIILDRKIGKNNGIKIQGCGMDMGFALVYELGHELWPKGTRKPHGTRNGEPDYNGGYALKHAWL